MQLVKIQFWRKRAGVRINTRALRRDIALYLVSTRGPRAWQKEWDLDDALHPRASEAVKAEWLQRYSDEFLEILQSIEVCEPRFGETVNRILITQSEPWLGVELFDQRLGHRAAIIKLIERAMSSHQRHDSYEFINAWEHMRSKRERPNHQPAHHYHRHVHS